MSFEVAGEIHSCADKKTTFDLELVHVTVAQLSRFLRENVEPTINDAASLCAECPVRMCGHDCEVSRYQSQEGHLWQKREKIRKAKSRLEWLNQILAAGGKMPDSRITSPLGELC